MLRYTTIIESETGIRFLMSHVGDINTKPTKNGQLEFEKSRRKTA